MRSLAGDLVPAPFSSPRFSKTKKPNYPNFGPVAGNIACLLRAGGGAGEVPANPDSAPRNQFPKCPRRAGSKLRSEKRNARRRWLRLPSIRRKFASQQDLLSSKLACPERPAWLADKSRGRAAELTTQACRNNARKA